MKKNIRHEATAANQLGEAQWRKRMAATLKVMRKERGLRQNAVAREARLHPQTLYKYESGENVPQLFTLALIARAFGCKVADIVAQAEEMKL